MEQSASTAGHEPSNSSARALAELPGRSTETPYESLDRLAQTPVAALFGNLSPITLALATADWAWHLAASPGRQLELARLASELALRGAQAATDPDTPMGEQDGDTRFRAASWALPPYRYWRQAFGSMEAFWREAARVPGVSTHHAQLVDFYARQWLDMLAPSNFLLTNPAVLDQTLHSGGANLLQGLRHWSADLASDAKPDTGQFIVGETLATTPGRVIYRNHLVELIRYTPQTERVHPEPVLIVPSWIMKYYILDLSPHNSMVRYLVEQGHVVYMVSWRNPDVADRDLTLDDYLELGVLESLRAVRQDARQAPVHAMGYCLGGTLLAIAAAALSRNDGMAGYSDLPAPHTLTLLAAQVDFSEPGELGLFIDEGQLNLLGHIMQKQGFLSGKQMGGSFQFLRSRDLVWTRRMRRYLMGESEQGSDLMAWNADTTRLPARMHQQYLHALYLKNALANGRFEVGEHPVQLADLQMPVFLVGTERDHVSPWRSVYKLHMLARTDITFALTSGGHNAGIVSEPGHPRRHYRLGTRPAHGAWLPPDAWFAQQEPREGSWWPAWQSWLADRSSAPVKARKSPASRSLGDAPGTYVMQRYTEP